MAKFFGILPIARPEQSYRMCVCVCHWVWSSTKI